MKTFGKLATAGILSVVLTLGSIFVAAAEDNDDLVDAINAEAKEHTVALDLSFNQFNSCADMNTVLKKYLEKFKDGHYPGRYRYGDDGMVLEEAAMDMDESAPEVAGAKTAVNSSSTDFSETNVQKVGVDEPELLKTDGDYLYYYNQQEQKIQIIKSPLDRGTATIDMNNVEVVSSITIPDSMYGLQLFVYEDRLVLLGTRNVPYNSKRRTMWLDRYSRTSVAIFDVANAAKPKLLKFTDVDGYFTNARRIDNKLYVLSSLNVNRWSIYEDTKGEIKKDGNFMPKAIDVIVDNTDRELDVVAPGCEDISYLFPDDDTLDQLNLHPEFTVVSVFDIEDTSRSPELNILLAQAGQIHMSQDALYIAQGLWFPSPRRCPADANCIMPSFDDGAQTLIHKFELDGYQLAYAASNVVPGSLLTQYSMDEYKDYFRILTRKNRREGTNFYVLDEDLKLKGSITDIEPGEEFKSSRYIGDKLYLVTFEQTDPLFVIDIADVTDPEIIGELKIPGYSTYLHPLRKEGSKQYLFGLGYDTDLNQRGGTITKGVKLDVYEVDYNNKETTESRCGKLDESSDEYEDCVDDIDTDRIRVSQVASKTLGGIGSWSDVLYNPRLFVMDSSHNVTLPLVLQREVEKGERCEVFRDEDGKEIESECYSVTQRETDFAGIKSFALEDDAITETFSMDYLDLWQDIYPSKSDYYSINQRQIRNTQMRAGFAGDALYMINNDFAHFVLPEDTDNDAYLYFDEELN